MATPMRRPAARTPTASAARTATRSAPRTSSGYRGAEGLRRMQEEEERAQARREAAKAGAYMPFRFFCPPGETREVIVVDEQMDFFRYEHGLKDRRTGKWNVFTACINEDANCPVCAVAERPAYFALYLTVIDLTPYESEKAGYVEWSKKLLVVKSMQQKKIQRLFERYGTLRGMRLSLTRDSEKDASIGNDIEYVEHVPEEELETYVSEYETERDGKKEIVEVIGYEPFDYDELFPLPTEKELRAIAGSGGGHRDSQDDGDDYERRPTRSRPAARSSAPSRPAARPPARRSRDEVEDADTDANDAAEDADQDRAPARAERRPPPSRSALRAPPARRVREEEADPEADAPQRASSLADRRRQLRRP